MLLTLSTVLIFRYAHPPKEEVGPSRKGWVSCPVMRLLDNASFERFDRLGGAGSSTGFVKMQHGRLSEEVCQSGSSAGNVKLQHGKFSEEVFPSRSSARASGFTGSKFL